MERKAEIVKKGKKYKIVQRRNKKIQRINNTRLRQVKEIREVREMLKKIFLLGKAGKC